MQAPRGERIAAEPRKAASGKIEKRDTATLKEKADFEFARGIALVNQGRVAEAVAALNTALALNPDHEAGRQALVALLLEARRLAEVEQSLRAGLERNPSNLQFAMLLARLMVERGDATGALATLDGQGAAGDANPEFLAFRAALEQRLGRHQQSVASYRAALALTPGAGAWWAGLGISQQSLSLSADALDSFRRARAAGRLAPELAAYVEQRIRQLQ